MKAILRLRLSSTAARLRRAGFPQLALARTTTNNKGEGETGMITTQCDFCGGRFTISRHSNQRGAGGKQIERHRFCCPAHRLADYRRVQQRRRETQASTHLAACVSNVKKPIENKGKNRHQKTTEHRWGILAGPALSDGLLHLATLDGWRVLRESSATHRSPSRPFKVEAAHISAPTYVIEAEIRERRI